MLAQRAQEDSMGRSDYDQAILDNLAAIAEEARAIRTNLERIGDALERANDLEANHPSRI